MKEDARANEQSKPAIVCQNLVRHALHNFAHSPCRRQRQHAKNVAKKATMLAGKPRDEERKGQPLPTYDFNLGEHGEESKQST